MPKRRVQTAQAGHLVPNSSPHQPGRALQHNPNKQSCHAMQNKQRRHGTRSALSLPTVARQIINSRSAVITRSVKSAAATSRRKDDKCKEELQELQWMPLLNKWTDNNHVSSTNTNN